MAKQLHPRPNPDHLRQQAKRLLADLKLGRRDAIEEFRQFLPAAAGLSDQQILAAEFRLADAQSAVARKTGFANWPKLAKHVETLRSLEGTWHFRSLETDGHEVSPSMLSSARILIDGDRFRSEMPGSVYDGSFLIDVEPRVSTIDINFAEGPEAGNMNYGIFRLSGDSLEICLDINGKQRPSTFGTRPGSGHAYEQLIRASALRPSGVTGGNARPAQDDSTRATQPHTDESQFAWKESPSMRRVQGNWKAIALVSDGQALPEMMIRSGRRTAKDHVLTVAFGGRTMIDAYFRIDESTDPISIDYCNRDCRAPGVLQHGILKWEGEHLVVSMAAPGQNRPTDFDCVPGSGQTLSRWEQTD